ncbi:hypothetical protein [Acinetobacter courvalinii]|uniref:hypothetical protein n=1 Tax=Acinetobacter courvalinii TaxID=280147 RepID=UPI0019012ED0|nr:hypothetical protein [Acinetobacter courvalinii]MBJ9955950.1 hypothetical protein [Acinetobacter courvalinii]
MKNFFKKNFFTIIGWILSVIWLMIVASLLYTHDLPRDLNAIGDFVAGMASPLAFLWVVIGYYQSQEALRLQAKELSQSSEALVHQVNEMRVATTLQKEQLEQVKNQFQNTVLSEKYNLQPFFDLRIKSIEDIEETDDFYKFITFELECIDGSARFITLFNEKDKNSSFDRINQITKGKIDVIQIDVIVKDDIKLHGLIFSLSYFDVRGNMASQEYMLTVNGQIKEMVHSRTLVT